MTQILLIPLYCLIKDLEKALVDQVHWFSKHYSRSPVIFPVHFLPSIQAHPLQLFAYILLHPAMSSDSGLDDSKVIQCNLFEAAIYPDSWHF